MSILRCTHCGTANREGSNFCNRCGTALHERAHLDPEIVSSVPTNTPDQPPVEPSPSPSASQPADSPKPPATRTEGTGDQQAAASSRAQDQPTSSGSSNVQSTSSTSSTVRTSDIPFSGADRGADRSRPAPLIPGLSGLLEPMGLASNVETETVTADRALTPQLTIPAAQLRRIRALVTEDPVLLEDQSQPTAQPPTRFRLPWLMLVVGLAVALPLLLQPATPQGEARRWTGVDEAHAAVSILPPNSTVWIFWAYDPATAGELDLVFQPLVKQLIEQEIQVQLVTLLPTGLATARRLWTATVAEMEQDGQLGGGINPTLYLEGGYLPGGAPALAFLAQSPRAALIGHTAQSAMLFSLIDQGRLNDDLAQGSPTLSIVVAAQAEDVQQWLELVQPTAYTPVIAVTAAGADLVLRPYLDSGQLTGLVSGFDGAMRYQELRGQQSSTELLAATQLLVAQNWGHIALIALLFLGNLSAIGLRQPRQDQPGENA